MTGPAVTLTSGNYSGSVRYVQGGGLCPGYCCELIALSILIDIRPVSRPGEGQGRWWPSTGQTMTRLTKMAKMKVRERIPTDNGRRAVVMSSVQCLQSGKWKARWIRRKSFWKHTCAGSVDAMGSL